MPEQADEVANDGDAGWYQGWLFWILANSQISIVGPENGRDYCQHKKEDQLHFEMLLEGFRDTAVKLDSQMRKENRKRRSTAVAYFQGQGMSVSRSHCGSKKRLKRDVCEQELADLPQPCIKSW